MIVTDLNPIREFRIGGTDLCIPFRTSQGTRYLLGDTFGGTTPTMGGPEWRSPMYLRGEPGRIDVTKPIRFISAARNAGQLWDYVHRNPVFNTVLPTDGIEIDGRVYIWVMVTKELGDEQWCEIWWTDDDGEHWTNSDVRWSTSAFGGMRVMVTWEKDPNSDWVYAMSTGGLARNKGLLLWRVHQNQLTDPAAWQGWGWNGVDWGWGRPPSDILHPWHLGEICLRWIEGQWVLSGFDQGGYRAFVKVLKSPIDNLHTAPTYIPATGNPQPGKDHIPRLYGCYIHPDSKFSEEGKGCLIVSEWALSNTPYRARQLVFSGLKPVNPVVVEEEADMADAQSVLDVLKNESDKVLLHAGRRDADGAESSFFTGSMREMLKNAAFEVTLWFPRRGVRSLLAKQNAKDTVLGHSIDAASWGLINHRLLVAICDKLEIDVHAVLADYMEDPQ